MGTYVSVSELAQYTDNTLQHIVVYVKGFSSASKLIYNTSSCSALV